MHQLRCEICGDWFTAGPRDERAFCRKCRRTGTKLFNTIVPDEIVVEFLVQYFANGRHFIFDAPRGKTWLKKLLLFFDTVRAKTPAVTEDS